MTQVLEHYNINPDLDPNVMFFFFAKKEDSDTNLPDKIQAFISDIQKNFHGILMG